MYPNKITTSRATTPPPQNKMLAATQAHPQRKQPHNPTLDSKRKQGTNCFVTSSKNR
jgi:hypothetical protein